MARDAWVDPLHQDDPFNRPIGSTAVYESITDTDWLAFVANPSSWSVWHPSSEGLGTVLDTDPLRNIFYYDEGTSSWRIWGQERISDSTTWVQEGWTGDPTGQSPTTEGDNELVLLQPDKKTYNFLFEVMRYSTFLSKGGVTIPGAVSKDLIVVQRPSHSVTIYRGLPLEGYAWRSIDPSIPPFGAHRGTPVRMIRSGELTQADGLGIDHGLYMFGPQTVLAKNHPVTGNNWVWPAAGADGSPPGSRYSGDGNLYLGALLALLPSLDLTSFAAAQSAIPGLETTQGWAIARAAQDWGIWFIETTSPASMRFGGEGTLVDTDLGGWGSATLAAWKRDVQRIVAACRLVSNSHLNGGAPPGNIPPSSGGTLRRPLYEAFGAPTVPAAPASAAIINITSDSVTTQADASGVSGETGFEIEYRLLPNAFTGTPQITDIPADTAGGMVSWVIGGLAPGNYELRWRSKGQGSDRSAWSNIPAFTIPTDVGGRKVLASGSSDSDLDTYQTSPFSTTADRVVLVAVQARTLDGSVPNTPTLSKGSLTFTLVGSVGISTYRKMFLFWAVGATSSAPLTISFGGQVQESCTWAVEGFSSVDTTSPIVQSVTGSIN